MPSSLDRFGFATPTTAGALADRLVATVCGQLEALDATTAPGLELPRVYGGHRVLEDAVADLAYVCGLLVEHGIERIGEVALRNRIPELIASLDPAGVEGFFSYRIGETVLRLGGLDAMPELADHVLAAVDTPTTAARVEAGTDIPPNFAVVLARCLLASARLAGRTDDPELDRSIDRVRDLLRACPRGWFNDGMGAWVQYDIYSPDVYLFAEPLADRLGDTWASGFATVIDDLDHLAQPGGAVVWGRSVGSLGLAMTIELAAVAAGRGIGSSPERWIARADETLDHLISWFGGGVVAAHQHRATMSYRGPHRRLQLTLDLAGKLLLAALELRQTPDLAAASPDRAWSGEDHLCVFDETTNASVWSFRSPSMTFALPTMCGFSVDYAPSPRGPGLFEQPTTGPVSLLPVLTRRGVDERTGRDQPPLMPAGLATVVEHQPGRLVIEHEGWAPPSSTPSDEPVRSGGRRATYVVDGRALVVTEELAIGDDPDTGNDPLTIAIPETPGRPVSVTVEGIGHRIRRVDTDGIAEWRSFWGPLPVVHEIELDSAATCSFTWRVQPRVRVASTAFGHQYDRLLYGPLADRVQTVSAGRPDVDLVRRMRDVDVLHLAWPEWWTGDDPARTQAAIDLVRAAGTAIVWTQHNLMPHDDKSAAAAACYAAWAQAADVVIHHSEAGEAVALATHPYGADCRHVVIPHGHWGPVYGDVARLDRAWVEASEGWPATALRLAVVGAPRVEKQLQLVVDAVVASSREDVQLVVRVDDGVVVPADPRIVAERDHIDDHRYRRRMQAYDALILPFAPAGMLTTGTAFDAIGAGVAAITSDWDFFDETFAGADIRYGSTVGDLTACIDALTPQTLEESRRAVVDRRSAFDWDTIAEATLAVLESVADGR